MKNLEHSLAKGYKPPEPKLELHGEQGSLYAQPEPVALAFTFVKPAEPVGVFQIYERHNLFYLYKKPRLIHRLFCRWLLGWIYINIERKV